MNRQNRIPAHILRRYMPWVSDPKTGRDTSPKTDADKDSMGNTCLPRGMDTKSTVNSDRISFNWYQGMTEKTELLVVVDEPDIRETISTYFSEQGFIVHEAADGAEMRTAMQDHNISLVRLDLRIPGDDGFALCRHLREHHTVGVVMLTGSADTNDKIIGLEIGADDYVSKPFDLRELLARLKSVLRRVVPSEKPAAAD